MTAATPVKQQLFWDWELLALLPVSGVPRAPKLFPIQAAAPRHVPLSELGLPTSSQRRVAPSHLLY
jgi:hypothetical protein